MVQLIRVSSRTTFAQKRVFPFVWFGVVAAMIAGILVAQGQPRSPPLAAILGPLVIGVIGFVAMKRSVFDLVDQVWDAGAELVIKNGDREVRVPLSDIVNVGYGDASKSHRVILLLRQSTPLGRRIAFVAASKFHPSRQNGGLEELILRIDAARSAAARGR